VGGRHDRHTRRSPGERTLLLVLPGALGWIYSALALYAIPVAGAGTFWLYVVMSYPLFWPILTGVGVWQTISAVRQRRRAPATISSGAVAFVALVNVSNAICGAFLWWVIVINLAYA